MNARGWLYRVGRGWGDVNAVRRNRVPRRVARRIAGKATGRFFGRLFG